MNMSKIQHPVSCEVLGGYHSGDEAGSVVRKLGAPEGCSKLPGLNY